MRYQQIAQTLFEAAVKNPHRVDQMAQDLVVFLKRKRLKKHWPFILKKLEEISDREDHLQRIFVKTARELSSIEKDKIAKVFLPKKVLIIEEIDKAVLGGVIIRKDDKIISHTIKSNLDALKEALWQIPIK